MKTKKSHDRAEGETQITISLPKSLKAELTELAKEDDRSRSKWIVRELSAIIARKKAGGKIVSIRTAEDNEPTLRAAEEAPAYGSGEAAALRDRAVKLAKQVIKGRKKVAASRKRDAA